MEWTDLDVLVHKLKMLVTIYDGLAKYSKCNLCRAQRAWCEICRKRETKVRRVSFCLCDLWIIGGSKIFCFGWGIRILCWLVDFSHNVD